MDTLDYDFFLDFLERHGPWLDETRFGFADDPEQAEHWLGCLPERELPYWVGGCDLPEGADFRTAQELMEAPIFHGASLRSRWPQVRIWGILGINLEDWLEIYPG